MNHVIGYNVYFSWIMKTSLTLITEISRWMSRRSTCKFKLIFSCTEICNRNCDESALYFRNIIIKTDASFMPYLWRTMDITRTGDPLLRVMTWPSCNSIMGHLVASLLIGSSQLPSSSTSITWLAVGLPCTSYIAIIVDMTITTRPICFVILIRLPTYGMFWLRRLMLSYRMTRKYVLM